MQVHSIPVALLLAAAIWSGHALPFTASGGVRQASRAGDARLPRLVVEGLPRAVRADLEAAYEAARGRPTDPSAVGWLAMLLHAYEQYRAADDCYRIVRKHDPGSARWIYLSGVVQTELGEHGAAATSFRLARRLDPDYLSARIRLADALMQEGDLRASHDEYAALARDLPELALAHYGLGRVSSIRGESNKAVEHYQRAVELAPQFGPAHYALALAYRDIGRTDSAEPHLHAYRQFGTRRPAVRDPLLERVRSLRETARDLLAEAARLGDAGRLEESIALQLKALELDAGAAQAHVNLIALYGRTGRPDEARRHYEAALRLGGSIADAHYNYGVLLASAQRDDEALKAFGNTLALDPFHAAAHNNAAALLARLGRFEEAAEHYRHALTNDPQHHTARFNLGRVLVLLGKPREAVDQFTRALDRAERLRQTDLAATIRKELLRLTEKK